MKPPQSAAAAAAGGTNTNTNTNVASSTSTPTCTSTSTCSVVPSLQAGVSHSRKPSPSSASRSGPTFRAVQGGTLVRTTTSTPHSNPNPSSNSSSSGGSSASAAPVVVQKVFVRAMPSRSGRPVARITIVRTTTHAHAQASSPATAAPTPAENKAAVALLQRDPLLLPLVLPCPLRRRLPCVLVGHLRRRPMVPLRRVRRCRT